LFDKGQTAKEPIDVNETTLATLHLLRGELSEHGVTTAVELASELPPVMGHSTQLQEVVSNLVRNAIDAMDPIRIDGRRLKVRTKFDGSKAVILEVEDSGPGIAPERLSDIFDPFVTTKANGMGLGLAICRGIIERHGGQLIASSDGSSGAIFQVVLPVEPAGKAGSYPIE
jgi:signal transduction histidine kinase